MITGALVGDKSLIARFKALPEATRKAVDGTTKRLGFMLQARVQQPYLTGGVFKVQTGRLRSSISPNSADSRSRFEATATSSVYFVGTNVSYAKPLFYGHAGYTVTAINAKALHFKIGGVDIFRKSVRIPPTPGKNVLAMALDDLKPTIVREYQQTLHNVAVQVLRS